MHRLPRSFISLYHTYLKRHTLGLCYTYIGIKPEFDLVRIWSCFLRFLQRNGWTNVDEVLLLLYTFLRSVGCSEIIIHFLEIQLRPLKNLLDSDFYLFYFHTNARMYFTINIYIIKLIRFDLQAWYGYGLFGTVLSLWKWYTDRSKACCSLVLLILSSNENGNK